MPSPHLGSDLQLRQFTCSKDYKLSLFRVCALSLFHKPKEAKCKDDWPFLVVFAVVNAGLFLHQYATILVLVAVAPVVSGSPFLLQVVCEFVGRS
jgi:hypothetical protein